MWVWALTSPAPSLTLGPLLAAIAFALRILPTDIARAAGESFIGSVVRRTPSKASSAPATAAAVGTRPISPTPLAPNGPSGSGSSTRITSTSGMSRARSTPELAQA